MKLNLKEHRSKRGWTLDHLADLAGTSKGYLSQLETGKRQPSTAMLELLAQTLQVRISDLIDAGEIGDDLATMIEIMQALSPEGRQAAMRQAAALLSKR